jgi:hypothetical protein
VHRAAYCSVLMVALAGATPAFADILDFEGFSDGTQITTQYSGFTFTNATVLTAGISLNEFEFPPHSGSNVVFDDGGPMVIQFATPFASVGGYFTYLEPLTFTAFDAFNNQIGSVGSLFSNNLALSGDSGSSPNEFLSLNIPTGISSVVITGDPAGGSFTLDDLVVTANLVATPEPTSLVLLVTVIGGIIALRSRRTRYSLPAPRFW